MRRQARVIGNTDVFFLPSRLFGADVVGLVKLKLNGAVGLLEILVQGPRGRERLEKYD